MKNYDEMANDVLRRVGAQNELNEERRKNRKKMAARLSVSLGCLCMIVIVGVVAWHNGLARWLGIGNGHGTGSDADKMYPGVYIPRTEIAFNTDMGETQEIPKTEPEKNPKKDFEIKHDYVSNEVSGGTKHKEQATVEEVPEYIEYEGRIYNIYWNDTSLTPMSKPERELQESAYLGTVNDTTSGITGNVEGKVYKIENVNEEVMLYVDYSGGRPIGRSHYYVNDNDITLTTGRDWYERFNVEGNVSVVSYLSSGYVGEIKKMPEALMPKINEFLDVLYDSPVVPCDEKVELLKENSIMKGFDLTLKNDVLIGITLMEGGYVLLDHRIDYPVCIKMEDQVFFDVFSMLQ